MKIQNVNDASFKKYGKILKGYPVDKILKEMQHTPLPDDVIYVPSVDTLEATSDAKIFQGKGFGGLDIEVGYCNGNNHKLNGLEYHRSSEINIAVNDLVLILGAQQDITDEFKYDTSKAEAFLVPKGTVIEVYATTLHYAPCGPDNKGFQVAVVLPKGTNYELTTQHADCPVCGGEDALITATNKWLIGHEEGGLPKGSFIGLKGKNLNVAE